MDPRKDPVDIDYLINSGLLFTINQQCLHMFGIGMVVKKDANGEKQLSLKDMRSSPETMVFTPDVYNAGVQKYKEFANDFGYKQIERRSSRLGWATQFCEKSGKIDGTNNTQ